MPADVPTIVATSGGARRGERTALAFSALVFHAIELSGVTGRAPRLCHVGTAGGDQRSHNALIDEAGRAAGIEVVHLNLFPMPNVGDVRGFLLDQDVVWVGGGSVANLLAVWRVHGLDAVFSEVWRAGVVLAGVSAGSICWHVGGTTDSYGPELQAVTNGLGFVPYANGVHYDSEPQRRPALHKLVADGVLPEAYATEDGVGLVYRDTHLAEAVSEVRGKRAYAIRSDCTRAVEEAIETRLLPDPL
jgi:peptidase E